MLEDNRFNKSSKDYLSLILDILIVNIKSSFKVISFK
jgi:hypothetical protein